jgi:hypothetical protein
MICKIKKAFKMKNEHPILMSTPMIQAILAGRKNQTRRIIMPQPLKEVTNIINIYENIWISKSDNSKAIFRAKYKYQIGMILWVRESFAVISGKIHYKTDLIGVPKWEDVECKPSIFMPKEACRIRLKIKNIRVERIQDISEEDVIAEGIESKNGVYFDYLSNNYCRRPIQSYLTLWTKINGKDSWDQNPWVWCIEFERLME